jgi:hypothetical protein
MARQNPDRIKGPSLTPQSPGSYPVDPYNRPPSESSSNLGRLASALGDLAPSLSRIAGSAMEGEKESAEAKAHEDFLNMQATGKAIKAGTLDPAGSPYFQRYYRESLGRLAASRYSQELTIAAADALSDETDPANFDAFTADFRAAWLKDNVGTASGDFMAGFTPAAAGYDINSRTSFASQASARLQGKAIKALYAGHQIGVTDILKARVGIVDDTSLREMGDFIKKANQDQYFLNPTSGRQISQTTVESVFDLARNMQDTRILDVLKHVDSAIPGASLWNTQEVQSKLQDVRNQIHADIKKDDAFAASQTKKLRQEAIDSTYDTLTEALEGADDPSTIDVSTYADALTGLAPEKRERLYALKDAYVRRDQEETAAQAGPLFERAFRGTLSFEDVADAFTVGQISKDTAKELRAQIRLTKTGKGSKFMIQDDRFKRAENDLEGLFKNQMSQYFSPTTAAQAQVSKWQLQRDWVRWRSGAGREAGEQEGIIWLQQRSAEVYANTMQIPVTSTTASEILSNFAAQLDGPVLSDYNKVRLVSGNFLERIAKEHAASVAAKTPQFSPAVQSFLRGYRVLPQDVQKFLDAQNKLPERP